MISFALIPDNQRTPGVLAEFDNSRAIRGLPGIPFRALMVGQKLAAGSQVVDVLVRATSADNAKDMFGEGSMLHRMAMRYFANNVNTELWAVALDDDGGAAAAVGTMTIGGAPTAAGTLVLYIAGIRLTVAVATADSASDIATAVVAAITAETSLPVTAALNVIPEQVDFTARHGGEAGNDIDLRVNYYVGEYLPAGVTVVFVDMASGATNPVLTPVVTAIGDEWFQVIALPYTDAAGLAVLETELEDRWGPMRAIEGQAFTMKTGLQSALLSWGDGRNSQFTSAMGVNSSPSPPWEWAAALAGIAAFEARQDPARPFQTLEIEGCLAPAEADRFTQIERNQLLWDGVSTFKVDNDGTVRIERLITTYQENASGTPDPSFLDVTTLFTLGYLRYSFRARFSLKYPRHKLADDGTAFGSGQAVLTPKIAKAEIIALFREWEEAALVENITQFKDDLIVERNADDPNRLDFLIPPDIINQLRIMAAKIEFRL